MKNPTCFGPCGIIVRDYVHQIISYKILTHSLMIIPQGSKIVGVFNVLMQYDCVNIKIVCIFWLIIIN
jgi:hypothetical protein